MMVGGRGSGNGCGAKVNREVLVSMEPTGRRHSPSVGHNIRLDGGCRVQHARQTKACTCLVMTRAPATAAARPRHAQHVSSVTGSTPATNAPPRTSRYLTMGDAAIARLSRTPWCHTLIASPQWTPTNTASRVPKASSEDSFFAETLGTDRTVRACLTLRPTDECPVCQRDADTAMVYEEVRTILELGDGLNGFPKIAHGGFVATMLDEVMGVLITTNIQARADRTKGLGDQGEHGMSCFTACELRLCACLCASDAWDRFEYYLQEAFADSRRSPMYSKVHSAREEQDLYSWYHRGRHGDRVYHGRGHVCRDQGQAVV